MKILAIDTTAASASAALCEDEFLLGEIFVNIRQTHSETLMPGVAELLARCRVSLSEIGLFAVATGPGSFTGVRIGVSAAKGMALPGAVDCAAVSSLEAAAMNLPCCGAVVCAVMDARRGQYYNALFEASPSGLVRLTEDRAVSGNELAAELKNSPKPVILVGDGAELCYNELNGMAGLSIAPQRLRFPRASAVAAAGLREYREGRAFSPEALEPFYLRLPQAERELKKIREASHP